MARIRRYMVNRHDDVTIVRKVHAAHVTILLANVLFCLVLTGCGDQVCLPSAKQLAEFSSAEPPQPEVDMGHLAEARLNAGAYRVVAGDVLEVTMSSILQVSSIQPSSAAAPEAARARVFRVSSEGTIDLPVAGEVEVAGKSLVEVDSAIAAAYHPRYSVNPPSVYTHVLEFSTRKVAIVGDVARPGVYKLASDEMSLVSLLMAAGGITDNGAARIRIDRPSSSRHVAEGIEMSFVQEEASIAAGRLTLRIPGEPVACEHLDLGSESGRRALAARLGRRGIDPSVVAAVQQRICTLAERLTGRGVGLSHGASDERSEGPCLCESGGTVVLPALGGETRFADVALEAGDRVVVERFEPPLLTVIGLVAKPGNFAYPRGAQYNLMQAIAFAGGVDRITEPRYATVYRLNRDSEIVSAVFQIGRDNGGGRHADAMQTIVKPGDIVALEHTPRTRSNVVLNRLFRINFGIYAPIDGWDDD
jgi:protein involved in polysaccharide export with SLBB domain